MPVAFQTSQEIVDLAVELLEPYRSPKTSGLRIQTSTESDHVNYTDESLIIPEPTSLNQAVFDILLTSVLQSNGLRPNDVQLALTELVQNLADLVVERFAEKEVETTEFQIDDRAYLHIPYKYVGVDDSKIRFVFLPSYVEIHTSVGTLVKTYRADELTYFQKPFIESLAIKYNNATGHFRAKVKKKLLEKAPLINGQYFVLNR